MTDYSTSAATTTDAAANAAGGTTTNNDMGISVSKDGLEVHFQKNSASSVSTPHSYRQNTHHTPPITP
jgi:hypothetical protein